MHSEKHVEHWVVLVKSNVIDGVEHWDGTLYQVDEPLCVGANNLGGELQRPYLRHYCVTDVSP